jgi:hypothetical protein
MNIALYRFVEPNREFFASWRFFVDQRFSPLHPRLSLKDKQSGARPTASESLLTRLPKLQWLGSDFNCNIPGSRGVVPARTTLKFCLFRRMKDKAELSSREDNRTLFAPRLSAACKETLLFAR